MSKRRTFARIAALPATVGILTVVAAAPASAHVTVTPTVASAGSYTVLTVALSHGCDGSSTTQLDVQIPEEILSVVGGAQPVLGGRAADRRARRARSPTPTATR